MRSWLEKHRTFVPDVMKYVGPGLLVTVGFIDPGNWAANVAAGSLHGYRLLWMVTLSTVILIFTASAASHEFRWKEALLSGVFFAMLAIGVFVLGLKLQLPV